MIVSADSGPRVIIWDSLSPTEKSVCLQELQPKKSSTARGSKTSFGKPTASHRMMMTIPQAKNLCFEEKDVNGVIGGKKVGLNELRADTT